MQFSLREFISLTAAASLTIVAVYFANGALQDGFHLVVEAAIAAAIIHAAVATGGMRAAAIGFLAVQLVLCTSAFGSGIDRRFLNLLTPIVEYVQNHRGEMGEHNGDPAWLPFSHHALEVARSASLLVLGYIGGKYAGILHSRRVERSHSARKVDS
ncbi:MAG: hypothetical protein AAF596_06690 [Planctomycetota bacterium]